MDTSLQRRCLCPPRVQIPQNPRRRTESQLHHPRQTSRHALQRSQKGTQQTIQSPWDIFRKGDGRVGI